MVASQSVEPQQNAEMYMHSPYGEYFHENHYYMPAATHHPEMCPAHVCALQGEFGPVTVPMVSTNSSPPIAMPVQVPPGHVVQQIVDESGTLRHVILSPQHPSNMVPLPSHNPQHYSPGPGNSTSQSQQFYAGMSTTFSPQHFHSNMQAAAAAAAAVAAAAGNQPVPSPTRLAHSPPPPPLQSNHPIYFKDERTQRQHIKLRKKLHDKQKSDTILTSRKELVNGLKRTTSIREKGMNSVGTSEDGEESSVPDEEDSYQIIVDILSSVQAPQVSELTSRSALLQWAPPIRLSETANNDSQEINICEADLRYEVLLSDKSKEMKFKSIYSGPCLSCRIQDLKPGQDYSVCLQVHLDELQGFATDPVKFSTPPCEPDQPLPPKLVHRTKNCLQLKWNTVNPNGSHILYYVLEYNDGKSKEFTEFCRGKGKTHTLQKLQPATTYRFRLAVVNEVGKSLYSDEVSYSTSDNPPAQPNPPTLMEATVQALHLQWEKRPKDDEFILQMNDVETKYGFLNVYHGKENFHVCRGLTRFSDYIFRLMVKNEDGPSPWSDQVTFRTLPDRPARPSKPTVKGRIHAHFFKLKWEPPSETGGPQITGYILEVNSGSGYETVYRGMDTEAICDKLTPGTTYQLRVSCVTAGGCSNYSDPCTVTTDAISPGQCPMPKLQGKAKANSVSIRWTEPDYNGGAPVLDYEVEMLSPDSNRCMVHKNKDTECTINGLRPGCEYTFTVRAVNRIGPGSWSEALKVTSGAAPPSTPEPPTVFCKSSNHAAIEWREPANNGAVITEYRLEMNSGNEEEKFFVIYQGPQLNFDVRNLFPFRAYYFRVQAGNSAGTSAYSAVAATITPAAPPSAITTLKGEATSTSIKLQWNPPADNGSPITHYNIEFGDKTISTEEPVTEFLLNNLHPNFTYKIKIQAVNSVAAGAYSHSLRITTLKLPPAPPKLECAGVGHNYLKLKWGEGKNIDYIQYCVEMENIRTKEFQCVYKGTAFTCKVNKLHETTAYKFRINASNDTGVGEFSKPYEFRTVVAPPMSVKMPKVLEVEQSACTLEWIPARNAFTDPVVYQVQLAHFKEQAFKQVQRTSEATCRLEGLEPGMEYTARILPIRVVGTGGELVGPSSPNVIFTCLSSTEYNNQSPTKAPSGSNSSLHSIHKSRSLYHSVRQLLPLHHFSDEYCTFAYVILIMLIGIFISLGIGSFL